MIELKLATIEDQSLIESLAQKIWRAYYSEFISVSQIEYMLNKFYSLPSIKNQMENGQHFYIINNGIRDIGFVSISESNPGQYFIHKFYIDIDEHGKNIGTEVIDQIDKMILKDVKNADNFLVRLTVNRQNFKAINFYFKNGFKIEKVEDFDIEEGYVMNDFVMIRNIPLKEKSN